MTPSQTSTGTLSQAGTDIDIIAVPAIGADPVKTWWDDDARQAWIPTELHNPVPNARVILIDHGPLEPHDSLDSIAQHLLNQILEERQLNSSRRPIFFICHSTGGLVAKAALVLAGKSESNLESALTSCYGIAFLATPHQGSSYLSAPEYAKSIRHLTHPKYHIPHRLREQFKPRHPVLLRLSNQFRAISEDMKLWTFLETVDSTLTITDSMAASTVEMNVPITSIRSGLLDLEHEKVIPLATNHVGTASFKGQEQTTRMSFIKELQSSAAMAVQLSTMTAASLHVNREVMVHVNGFFEDTARGVSDETPLKLWSTSTTLRDYLDQGPSMCLSERLTKTGAVPPGSLDGSSVSSFSSPRSSAAFEDISISAEGGFPRNESTLVEPDILMKRPSIKKSRSFVKPSSPRIHITEPTAEGYFELSKEDETKRETSDDQASHEGDGAAPEDPANNQKDNSASLPDAIIQNQNLLASLPSRYKSLLPVPNLIRERLIEFRNEAPRRAPRFDRPEPGSEKLLWIHIPYTHTGWVPQVLAKACDEDQRPEFFRRYMSEENWFSNLIRARHLEPHARYVRPTCIHSRVHEPGNVSPIEMPKEPQLAIYIPYLHWDTYYNLLQRRKVVEQRLKQGRSRPAPDHISESDLESKLIWKYLGNEPSIHIRRTLDQFGYPNLRSTVARDDDQMLWKRTKKAVNLNDELRDTKPLSKQPETPPMFMDGKVLMVDQLWLWIVDQKTVVTFFPKQEATTAEGKLYEQGNLYNSIYNELNGDLATRFETAGDLAALIVLHSVTVLLDRTLHHDLQILRIFEESISILTESMTKSFKRFRSRGFITRPVDYNKTPEGKTMTATEREERDHRVAGQNREDLSSLLELRDIVDELGTILKLLEEQTNTIKIMARYFEDKGYGKAFIEVALNRLDQYRNQVNDMKDNAYAAQKAVENLLDLKQKQANVDESRLARWEAEVTQNQSQSVMVFTIFTVIFLPLSFFTSLFGINVREWSGEETNPDFSYMLAIAGPTSVAIIVVALLMAFSERLRETVVETQRMLSGIFKDFTISPIRMVFHWKKQVPRKLISPSVSTESTHLRDRFGRYRRHQRQLDDDIWKRHEDRMITPLPPVDLEGLGYEYNEKGKQWYQRNGAEDLGKR
ncbi:hypothetical protein FE257_002754 [Aspergillus nanangensis]|uniref:DUF676 domain-containing protein n=1 Tax=Aspergillus nanangensis TaxID=2582783 RepID=A0AAD4CDM4_ASPNN|nr:hypothetical protein FE257_002754 [Aspergillus nanangensis]